MYISYVSYIYIHTYIHTYYVYIYIHSNRTPEWQTMAGGGDLISIPPCSRFLTDLTPMMSYDHTKENVWLAFKKVEGVCF